MSTAHGFAFLCMPKCASTSIESALADHCNVVFSGHSTLKHINSETFSRTVMAAHRELLPQFPIETFCLVRDPLEWIESWYRFRQRREIANPDSPNHKYYTGQIPYNDFVFEYVKRGRRAPWANLRRQIDFLSLPDGQIGVDRIFAMDDLEGVASYLSKKLGTPVELPRKNPSPRVKTELGQDAEAALRSHLAHDIVIYDFVNSRGGFDRSKHGRELYEALRDHHIDHADPSRLS